MLLQKASHMPSFGGFGLSGGDDVCRLPSAGRSIGRYQVDLVYASDRLRQCFRPLHVADHNLNP